MKAPRPYFFEFHPGFVIPENQVWFAPVHLACLVFLFSFFLFSRFEITITIHRKDRATAPRLPFFEIRSSYLEQVPQSASSQQKFKNPRNPKK